MNVSRKSVTMYSTGSQEFVSLNIKKLLKHKYSVHACLTFLVALSIGTVTNSSVSTVVYVILHARTLECTYFLLLYSVLQENYYKQIT